METYKVAKGVKNRAWTLAQFLAPKTRRPALSSKLASIVRCECRRAQTAKNETRTAPISYP